MKKLAGALTVRFDNDRPPLDTDWVVTADGRLWHHGTYEGKLCGYVIATTGVELDFTPRPVPDRARAIPPPSASALCRCPDGADYSPSCPLHPMPQGDPLGSRR